MKELSLHILDIAQNSVAAGAASIELTLQKDGELLTIEVADDGRGMPPALLKAVTSPFVTTRATRPVGLGLPLFRLAAEQTGGTLSIQSAQGAGTTVTATFHTGHIDCPPLGDMAASISLLIQGAPELEVCYRYRSDGGAFSFDTREIRAILGPDLSLGEAEICLWIQEYLRELEAGIH